MHAALGHLRDDAEELHADAERLVLECLDEVFAAAGPGGGGEAAAGDLAPARPKGPCDDGEERGGIRQGQRRGRGEGRGGRGRGRGASGDARRADAGRRRQRDRRRGGVDGAARAAMSEAGWRRGDRVGTGAGVNGAGRAPRRRRRTSACASCARGFRFRAVAPAAASREGRLLGVIVRPVSLRPHRGRASTRGRATFARGLSLELSRVAVRTPRVASCARRAPHRHRLVGCGGEAHHDGRRDDRRNQENLYAPRAFPRKIAPRGHARFGRRIGRWTRILESQTVDFSRFTRLRGHVPTVLSRLGQLDPSRVAGAQTPTRRVIR